MLSGREDQFAAVLLNRILSPCDGACVYRGGESVDTSADDLSARPSTLLPVTHFHDIAPCRARPPPPAARVTQD